MNGERTKPVESRTEDRRNMPERVWIGQDTVGLLFYGPHRPERGEAVEYMRVLSRQEVDKLAGEGIDVQQYINSLLRTIEGQKRHISRLVTTLLPKDSDDE